MLWLWACGDPTGGPDAGDASVDANDASGDADSGPDVDAGDLPPISVLVDPELEPRFVTIPAYTEGAAPRPIAAMASATGHMSHYVENELIIHSNDTPEVEAFVARWNGEVLFTHDPSAAGIDAPTLHVVRISTELADSENVVEHIRTANPGVGGDVTVSSQAALEAFTAAMEEISDGGHIGINWVFEGYDFVDRSVLETQTGPGAYDQNVFNWPHFSSTGVQRIGVAEAWRMLDLAGALGNKVRIAILDGGFAPNPDFQPILSNSAVEGDPALNTPGPTGCGEGNPCPWHGTNVATVAAGIPNNGSGIAGTGGPVGELITIHLALDTASVEASISAAVDQGARIINMSFGGPTPALAMASLLDFEAYTESLYDDNIALLLAASGNEGEDVDATDCFGACWEENWYVPCENAGVICVGGTQWDSLSIHENSNYGLEDVDLFAPYTLYVGIDPEHTDNEARWGSGTSYSTPFIAGIAALVMAADPTLTVHEVAVKLSYNSYPSPDPLVDNITCAAAAVRSALGNVPPHVEIITPTDGATMPANGPQGITFIASVDDYMTESADCTVTWSSDVDGPLGTGHSIQHLFTSTGTRTITATAEDHQFGTGEASVTINVTDEPPLVWITEPTDGQELFSHVPYSFLGGSFDMELGAALDCDDLSWSSVVVPEGRGISHGTGCRPEVTFAAPATRVITLIGTDDEGNEGQATVTIDVLAFPTTGEPVPTIHWPLNASSLPPDEEAVLVATATDPDDPDDELGLTWRWTVANLESSRVETDIGSSPTILWMPQDDVAFTCGGQNIIIRVYVTDAAGETGTAEIDAYVSYPLC